MSGTVNSALRLVGKRLRVRTDLLVSMASRLQACYDIETGVPVMLPACWYRWKCLRADTRRRELHMFGFEQAHVCECNEHANSRSAGRWHKHDLNLKCKRRNFQIQRCVCVLLALALRSENHVSTSARCRTYRSQT